MFIKNILRVFRRSHFFTTINIIGLSIGLAVSIMLILFVLSELSYDKYFADSDRIISLNTVMGNEGEERRLPISTRKAITEVPDKVPGIEASTQIYKGGHATLVYNQQRFEDLNAQFTESSFFDVFNMTFVEGTKKGLDNPNTIVITDKYAKIIFGGAKEALDKTVTIGDDEFAVCAVVKELPRNTHFTFDILIGMMGYMKEWPSIEFFTFYKIEKGISVDNVSKSIEKEYTILVREFLKSFSPTAYGVTEKFTDIYLHTKASFTLGERSSMDFVLLLSLIAVLILLLAITNFVNLFVAQGEKRMAEIGIRKTNGAEKKNIISLFFSEIGIVVFISFVIAFVLALALLPHFSDLIKRTIDTALFYNPIFIFSMILLFVITVTLSASYPSFYLGKFSPLDILGKRIRFSKRRLTAIVVVFQSIVSIVLLSYIFVVNKQTTHLEGLPLGYNPNGVMMLGMNNKAAENYTAIKQELTKLPIVKGVSTAGHPFGGGASGQGIALLTGGDNKGINEYRIAAGICEIMELTLIEGRTFTEEDPQNEKSIILNEAAIQMLGLNYPVVGTTVDYKGQKEIIGVTSNFIYGMPQDIVEPIVLSCHGGNSSRLYIKFDDGVARDVAREIVQNVFRQIDSEFIVSPMWAQDIYDNKFNNLEVQSKILFYASLLAILISMLGLLATHAFTTARRTKEIAIRRVNGASSESIFMLLSKDVVCWIALAGIIAAPLVYYISTNWLNDFSSRTSIGFGVFLIPVLLQLLIGLITTSGISAKVLSSNPVTSLNAD